MTEMIEEVKEAFKTRLEEKDWLDDTTKERCAAKVDAITEMVAYPDQIYNDTYLNELYARVGLPAALYIKVFLQFLSYVLYCMELSMELGFQYDFNVCLFMSVFVCMQK